MKKLFILPVIALFCSGSMRAQSELWGMTTTGGASYGTIYGMPTGSTGVSAQYNFIGYPGSNPQHTKLILASNGKMYGLTFAGGVNNVGVLFEYDPSTNAYSKKADFATATGAGPRAALVQASNGKLYGTTSVGGANNVGVIFEYDITTSTYTKKIDLTGAAGVAPGSQPYSTMVEAPNGLLYATTRQGGATNTGVIFEYDPATNTYTKKVDLATASGSIPYGELVLANNGLFYGLTNLGGANNIGVIFEYDYVNNVYTKKTDLSTTLGSGPQGSLMRASNNKLYALTQFNGTNNVGTILEYDVSTSTATKLYDMVTSTGANATGAMVQASSGKLYGMTRLGGANLQGAIFEFDLSTNTYTKKADLASTSSVGGVPFGSMSFASNGKLYGLTSAGGTSSSGVLFEYDISSNTYTKKLDLNSSNGGNSNGHLILAPNGKLYGMSLVGGANNLGVIFEYDKATSTYTKKIDLSSTGGSSPYSSLLLASNGKMYGTTSAGGSANLGVIFEYDYTTNTYTKKIDLTAANGSVPYGSLMQASNGKLYGLTKQGGSSSQGTLFEYDYATNTYTKKVDLTATTGYSAFGVPVEASNGKLYGLTMLGGTNSQGTLFEYDPSTSTFTKMIDLTTGNGGQPTGSMVKAANGNLYGMTRTGGANALGVIFEYDVATNAYTKKIDLTAANGSLPQGSLIKAANGNLYGVTSAGGTFSVGVLFEYNISGNTFTKKMDFTGTNGSTPGYTQLLEVCTLPVIPGAISSSTNALCAGSAASITSSIAAVANATSYSWVLPAGASVVSGSTTTNLVANLGGVAAGTYTYGVGGVNICGTGSLSINTVSVHALPTISVNSGTICSGKSFTMVPSGAASYVYSSGSNVVSPLSNTSYSVTGTSAQGCVSGNTAVASVTVVALPVISVNSGTICNGSSFTMTPGGASTYVYSSGSNVVSPSTNTTYSVTGTSAAGCVSSNTAVASVTVHALPVVSVNSGTICNGGSFTMNPSGAASYVYSSGSNIVSPAANTSYSVTGTSAQGCISATPAISNVTVFALPLVSVNSGTICSGASFTMVPGGAATYVYSSGSNVVSPLSNTSYSVTGTSSQGCVSSNTAVSNVTVIALPVIGVNSGSICAGNSFTLVPSGAASYVFSPAGPVVSPLVTTSYSVSGTASTGCSSSAPAISTITVVALPTISVNSGTTCAGTAFTIVPSGAATYSYAGGSNIVNPAVNTTYTVVGYNSAGCVSSNTPVASVTVIALPVITATGGAICAGNSFTIQPSGASTYTYSGGSQVVSPGATTSYSVTGTSAAGCESGSPAIITVTVNSLPIVTISGSTVVCNGQSATLTANGASTYNWGTSTGQQFVLTPSVSATYSVLGTDVNGCSSMGAFFLAVNPLPTITAASGAICPGDSYTITPSGATTYTYSSGSNVVSPSTTTSYSVTGTSSLGCVSAGAAVVTVSVVNILTVSITGNSVICSGQPVNLTANGANTYSWSTGSSANIVTVSPVVNTSYTVVGSSGTCHDTAYFAINVNALPVITASAFPLYICLNETATLTANGAVNYSWGGPTGSSIVVSPLFSTSYTVTGIDQNGCMGSAIVNLAVDACTGLAGGDPENDRIQLYPNPNEGAFTISVFTEGSVILTDGTGRVVLAQQLTAGENHMELKELARGLYFANVRTAGTTECIKIIRQ